MNEKELQSLVENYLAFENQENKNLIESFLLKNHEISYYKGRHLDCYLAHIDAFKIILDSLLEISKIDDIGSAIAKMKAFIKRDYFYGNLVVVINGWNIKERITLNEFTTLEPLDKNDEAFNLLLRNNVHYSNIFKIKKFIKICPITVDGFSEKRLSSEDFYELYSIANWLTLLGKGNPQAIGEFFELNDPFLREKNYPMMSHSSDLNIFHKNNVEITNEDHQKITEIYNLFLGLGKNIELRNRIEVALIKLNNAKGRNSLSGSILDITTALEVLLVYKVRSQKTYTFKTRGAWLIGKDDEERKFYFQMLNDLYEARSKVAHEGFLGTFDITDLRKKAIKFASEVIYWFARNKVDPDWDKVVLGEIK